MNVPFLRLFAAVALVASFAMTATAQTGPPAARYTTTTNTVYDNKTKLTWQRMVAPNTYNETAARVYCASEAVTTILGGAGRLPTLKELQSIVDYSRRAPAIDPDAFPSNAPSFFWSASLRVGSSSSDAWGVNFYDGDTYTRQVNSDAAVRCVH